MTRRTEIIDLLRRSKEGLTARQISGLLNIPEPTVERDLKHIARSLHRHGERLMTCPATCVECGFRFAAGTASPSKCPRCRSSRIRPPSFIIGGARKLRDGSEDAKV